MVLVGSRPVGRVLRTGSRDTKRVIGSHGFANRASL